MNKAPNSSENRHQSMMSPNAINDMIITDFLDKATSRLPHRPALVSYRVAEQHREALSYRQLDLIVTRLAAGLAALGVGSGEVVSCQLPNSWVITALHLACVRIGAVFNPLMPIFRERELRFMLAHAESRVLVVPRQFRGLDYPAMVAPLRAELPALQRVLVVGGEDQDSFETTLLDEPWEQRVDTAALFKARRPAANDVVQLLYTSGTTGEPKGVLHTSNTLFSNVRPYVDRLGLTGNDKVLMASPLAHQTGFLYGLMMPLYLGSTAILQDTWDAPFAIRVIAREQPAFTMAATPFLADLLELADQHRDELASLRIFVSAGAPIPGTLVERAATTLNTRVLSAWGMTENGAVTLTRPEDDPARSVTSDGLALPGMEVRIVDHRGQAAPPDTEGDLQVRGASLFVGYLKRPELYQVDGQGWFATGDLARLDRQGYLRLTGRTKDVVIRGGENIPVVEIENLLYRHPDLAAVALVGCPDDRLGERLCAYATVREGHTAPTLEQLCDFLLEQRLAKTYLPEYLEVLDDLPRTPSGKIQKFKLRERANHIRLPPAGAPRA